MGKLVYSKYVSLCVLGGELAYAICIQYKNFVAEPLRELHLNLLSLIPGFSMDVTGYLMGAFWVLVMSVLFGTYIVWMHNISIQK